MQHAVEQLLEAWRTHNRINLLLIQCGHDLDQATRYSIRNRDRI